MADKIKVAVMGASGRMGQALIRAVVADTGMVLIGATERIGHNWIGHDIGACLGGADIGAKVVADAADLFAIADAVIDFTSPESSVLHAELAAQAKCVLVIGTTGFSDEHYQRINVVAGHTRVIQSGNMSLGINLLVALTRQLAFVLDNNFDIEILDTHHRNKVDSPSGTALMLGVAAAEGRGVMLRDVIDRASARDGVGSARAVGAIGFSSVLGGDVVGEHDVIFAADGERIVLRHVATDRTIFVRGALQAVRWGMGQTVGLYTMQDVLGLKININR